MASIVGKKRGNATYYYLVEAARVDGKPRIVSQEYLGTAGELAAAMRGGGLGLPDRTGHKEFGAVAAAWGVLEDLWWPPLSMKWPDLASGLPLSAGTYLVLAALNRWSRRARSWPSRTGGRPPPPPGSPRSPPRHWITAGSGTRDAVTLGKPEEISRQLPCGSCMPPVWTAVGGAGHDQLRDLHRHRQRQGAGGAARQGQQKRADLRLVGLGLVVTRQAGSR